MLRARVITLLLLLGVLTQTLGVPLASVQQAYAMPAPPDPSTPTPTQSNGNVPTNMGTLPPTGPLPSAASGDLALEQTRPAFELNMGQQDPQVRFLSHLSGSTVFFTPDETVFVLGATSSVTPSQQLPAPSATPVPTAPITTTIARLEWIGASTTQVTGTMLLQERVNYFIGDDPAKWHTDIPTYGEIIYRDLYPGVDMTYATVDQRLKSTYQVAPGADPTRIRWHYEGALSPTVDAAGNLQIHMPIGTGQAGPPLTLTEQAPVAWQDRQGQQVPVTTRYTVAPDGTVGFSVGSYDPKQPLVLDPTLSYSTFLGGSGDDAHNEGTLGDTHQTWKTCIALDAAGNMYVAGATSSVDFPGHGNPYPTLRSSADAFIAAFDPSGHTLLYFTYLGGSVPDYSDDHALALWVSRNGNDIYVGGYTGAYDFPTTSGSIQDHYINAGDNMSDGFVAKLTQAGTHLAYSSYLGSHGFDVVYGIAVDTNGFIYLTGVAGSGWGNISSTGADLISQQSEGYTHYAYQETWQTYASCGFTCSEPFLMKLNPDLSLPRRQQIVYSTYFGNDTAKAFSIALDSDNNVYIAGCVGASAYDDCPSGDSSITDPRLPLRGQLQAYGGNMDGFVAEFNPRSAGDSSLIFSTYYGSAVHDEIHGIALDSSNNIYLAGWTSVSSPVNLREQAFVTKLTADHHQWMDTNVFGGDGDDEAWDIGLDANRAVYVTGFSTGCSDPQNPQKCPLASPYTWHGGKDAFVASYSGTHQNYFTYLGGTDHDRGMAIAVDATGNAYIAGNTRSRSGGSNGFPVVGPPFQGQNAGPPPPAPPTTDVFVARFSPGTTSPLDECTRDEALGAASTCAVRKVGDGVNTLYGNYWYTGPGLAFGGDTPGLSFVPSYNSQLPTFSAGPQPLGTDWTHSYNMWITHDTVYWHVHLGDGSVLEFPAPGTAPARYGATLTATPGCYQSQLDPSCEFQLKTIQDSMTYSFMATIDGETFNDHTARLRYITDRYQHRVSLNYYSGHQQIYQVTGVHGQYLAFSYFSDAFGLLESVTLHAGSMQRGITFTHSGAGSYYIDGILEGNNSAGYIHFQDDPAQHTRTISYPNSTTGYGSFTTQFEATSPYRVHSQATSLRRILTMNYSTVDHSVEVIDNVDTRRTEYQYDNRNRIGGVAIMVGSTIRHVWTYTYSAVFPIGVTAETDATDPQNLHTWAALPHLPCSGRHQHPNLQ